MPPNDSPAILVARFLKANNYLQTYAAFVAEADLVIDVGTTSTGDLTLEKLLDEKRAFDISANFEKVGFDGDGKDGWQQPAPEFAQEVDCLAAKSNVLSVSTASIASDFTASPAPLYFVSTADRRLTLINPTNLTAISSFSQLQDSPILSSLAVGRNYIVTASMSGTIVLSDAQGNIIEKRRDHNKYIVKIITDSSATFLVSAAWDNRILIYRPQWKETATPTLGAVCGEIGLPTKPEAILFTDHEDYDTPILIVTRTDSSFLYYYTIANQPLLIGKQNLAPHSNAWVAFTPSAIALCPNNPLIIAAALSTLPHMKLIIVRLLIPRATGSDHAPLPSERDSIPETQASQARRELAIADREHAAIQIHCNTMAPQTVYSTPAIAWRPNGSGIWVNGDDGIIRGIEAQSGKVVATLRGHEPGSKVRCIWSAQLSNKEVLISGGFDQKLLVWQPQS